MMQLFNGRYCISACRGFISNLRGENVAVMNVFHHAGKPAIIAQKLQRAACNKLHMKPRPWPSCLANKKHLKNVGPIRHCEPLHCYSPGVATVARRLRIDVHNDDDDNNDNNDNA